MCSMRLTTFVAVMLLAVPAFVVSPATAEEPAVRIALLDSGILASHVEFSPGQVVAWKDFVNGQPAPYDDQGHGTAVASRAAGRTIGAYPGADLIVGKVLDANNFAPWSAVAAGIRWAVDEGADVVSISIWNAQPSASHLLSLSPAIGYAADRGVLVVWIAGNGGNVAPFQHSTYGPGASSPQVLVVGAADELGRRAPWSQQDPEILGPGWSVPVARLDGHVGEASGTSYAAPWVAGAAARLIADGAPRDPDWLKWVITHSARDTSELTYLTEGYGYFGHAERDNARAIARGEAPMPGFDSRDAPHLATAAARGAQSGMVPLGALPP